MDCFVATKVAPRNDTVGKSKTRHCETKQIGRGNPHSLNCFVQVSHLLTNRHGPHTIFKVSCLKLLPLLIFDSCDLNTAPLSKLPAEVGFCKRSNVSPGWL
jgi:hypothetical protein